MIKPCPICGKDDEIERTSYRTFTELQRDNGNACLLIRCERCSLSLYDFDLENRVYRLRLNQLVEKWNSMPRREEENAV